MAKEGSTVSGPDGLVRDRDLARPPVRRAAARPRQQVRPRPVRAVRLHRQQRDPDRQVDRGLHLPLARLAVPDRGRQGSPRASSARAVVSEAPGYGDRRASSAHEEGDFGDGIDSPAAGETRTVEPKRTDEDAPRATAVAAEPAPTPPTESPPCPSSRRSRTGTATERPRQRQDGPRRQRDRGLPRRDLGRLQDPGRRPVLRRLRLDHGPQRQLLQVPQLRLHERVQLSHGRITPPETRLGSPA